MRLLLGTHEPTWLGRSPVELFVSMERAHKFGRRPALAPWALDSGGYTRLHHGGWTTTPTEYLESVYQLGDRCPGMEWAAPQDWMCEQSALDATGLTVEQHQHLTVDNYLALREIDERQLIIPVLQGSEPGDHEHCADLYLQAGIDLREQALVGVGSICRRQASREIAAIIHSLKSHGLNLHGFGVKSGGLQRYANDLISADSLAWSYRARKAAHHGEGPLGTGCTHKSCANCYQWAHQWRTKLLTTLTTLNQHI